MKQILVGKNLAYAAKSGGGTIAGINEINLLDTGAIAVFTGQNELVTNANKASIFSDRKSFYIAVGNQVDTDSKTMISLMVPRIGTNYVKQAYIAPVKQVKYVGDDGTTANTGFNFPTLVVGLDDAEIKITDTTLGLRTIGINVKRYNAVIITGSTAATLQAALVATINGDPDSIVVAAAVGTTGISLTAKLFGTTFDIACAGVLQSATIEEVGGAIAGVAVAVTLGEGSSDLVQALEDEYSVERGNTNRLWQPQLWYSNHSLVISSTTYNIYTYGWTGKRDSATVEQSTYREELKVAIPSSGTVPTTIFEAIMTYCFGEPGSVTPPETGS